MPSTRSPLRSSSLLFVIGALASMGCGDDPFVGAPCDSVGSTDACGEGEGLVCDQVDGESLCLAICDKQEDCPDGQSCNGVSKSSIKACHPDEDEPL